MSKTSGRILLIEDNKETQLLIKVLLRNYYKLDIAGDSDNSVKLLNENEYSLILLDINLSKNKEGITILEHIRSGKSKKDLPVIVITAYDLSDDENQFLSENTNALITKPFDNDYLINAVRENIIHH